MLANIIGFQMQVELLEGKFKLGQERSEADRQGILKNLQTARGERSLHDLTESFYRRKA
jgi:transcriptional regulator